MQQFNAAAIFESMGVDTSKANAPTGGRSNVVGSFRNQWDSSHTYVLVGACKAGDTQTGEVAEDVRSTAQGGRLNEWYAADCSGNGTHAVHRIVFGADSRPTSEFNKYGKANHAAIATPDGVSLARIRTEVKKMAAPRATFTKLPPVGAVFTIAPTTRTTPRLAASGQPAPQLPAGK